MASDVDLHVLLAAVDQLVARGGDARGSFLLDHGLSVHDTLDRWTYSATPMNSVTFASTGGDGVHFGILQAASAKTPNGPVVTTVPTASRANHVIAGCISEFLGLGCMHGWGSLEQLAYRPAYAFELHARADPPTAAPIASLFRALSIEPIALQPNRLKRLSQQYDATIVLAPPEVAAEQQPFDLDAFLVWKRSKYGGA